MVCYAKPLVMWNYDMSDAHEDMFTEEDAEIITAIVNASLYQLIEDALDGLYDKGYSEDILEDLAESIIDVMKNTKLHIYLDEYSETLH